MSNEIKNLLDDITNSVDSSYSPEKVTGVTFDSGKFREKLSLYVLKDIVCAMLDENIEDADEMVDNSIMKHINDNYNGSCYGYLCHARDRLRNPEMNVFGNIIQEIDHKCKCACESACSSKNVQEAAVSDAKELLDGVDNYEQLRDKLKKEVSEQVVNDVTKVITQSADAPSFDTLDKKVTVVDKHESAINGNGEPPEINPEGTKDPENDITNESLIIRRMGDIIVESAINGVRISQEEAYETAIVEYAISQMDVLTKAHPKKYDAFLKFMQK